MKQNKVELKLEFYSEDATSLSILRKAAKNFLQQSIAQVYIM